MVSNSVDFLSYKPDVTPASSTNHKADIINQHLQEHKILLQIVARHPDVLAEYVNTVKKGELAAHPAEATNPRPMSLITNGTQG